MKLPDMPMEAVSCGANIHNSKVYISAVGRDGNGKLVSVVLVYSTNEHKWSTLSNQQFGAAIAVVNKHVTLIGGRDVSVRKVTNTLHLVSRRRSVETNAASHAYRKVCSSCYLS